MPKKQTFSFISILVFLICSTLITVIASAGVTYLLVQKQLAEKDKSNIEINTSQLSSDIESVKNEVEKIKNTSSQPSTGNQRASSWTDENVARNSLQELVQQNLLKKSVTISNSWAVINPFSEGGLISKFYIPTAIWNKYPVQSFAWGESNELRWSLNLHEAKNPKHVFSDAGPGISIDIKSIVKDFSAENCNEQKYSEGVRYAAGYFKQKYPDDAWQKDPCSQIKVSMPLLGGDAAESNGTSTVPIPVRAYIYQPKKKYNESIRIMVADVIIARERKFTEEGSVTEIVYNVVPELMFNDPTVTEDEYKKGSATIKNILPALEKTELYGMCIYGSCY